MYRLKVRADPVYRESRLISNSPSAAVMYPITDERVGDLMDNEVRVSIYTIEAHEISRDSKAFACLQQI